jgi:hypothetical protein
MIWVLLFFLLYYLTIGVLVSLLLFRLGQEKFSFKKLALWTICSPVVVVLTLMLPRNR